MSAKRTRTSASQRTEALERRVRELEAQVCNLAIQVAALAARSGPTYPGVPYMPFGAPNPVTPATPLHYEITCDGTPGLQTPTAPDYATSESISYGGTS